MRLINKAYEILNFEIDFFKLGDFIYHEGPLLSHYSGTDGIDYIFKWVDYDPFSNRWLVFKVNNRTLLEFLKGELNQYDLAFGETPHYVYLIDIDTSFKFKKVFYLPFSKLPESYKPSKKSFYLPDQYEKYSKELLKKLKANEGATKLENESENLPVPLFGVFGSENFSENLRNSENEFVKAIVVQAVSSMVNRYLFTHDQKYMFTIHAIFDTLQHKRNLHAHFYFNNSQTLNVRIWNTIPLHKGVKVKSSNTNLVRIARANEMVRMIHAKVVKEFPSEERKDVDDLFEKILVSK